MQYFNSFSRSLAIAVLLAMMLAGCGKEAPAQLTDSAKALAAKGEYKAAAIQLRNVLQKQPENAEARYLLGQVLYEERDYVTAEKELRKALEYGYAPDGAVPPLVRAVLGQHKNKELVAEFKGRVLADREANASLQTDLGLAYFRLGQRDEAGEAFAAALAAKPGYAQARVGQGILAATEGDVAGATKIIDEVLATPPTLPDALSLKADLLLAQNDTEGAVKVVEQLVKLQPARVEGHYVLASLLIRQRKYDSATAEIAVMKKAFPTDVRVDFLSALLAYRQGEAAKTRDAVQHVLKAMPNHVPSLFLAGAADYKLKSYETAAERLRQVLSQYPQSAETQTLLISTYAAAGKPEKAEEVVEAALRSAPNDLNALRLAGEVALANNDLAKASGYYVRAAALDKDNVATRTRLGQVRLAAGDIDAAMADLESASELDVGGYRADLGLVVAHLQRKEFDQALKAAAVLEKKQPANPLTYNVKGVIYGQMGDDKNARANFAKALELQFDYLPAARNLARLDIREKNPAAARSRFEAIIAKQPKNDEAIIALADVLATTGAPPRDVIATLDRAISANPESVTAKLALGNYLVRSGDPKSALPVLQGASAANPNDTRILDSLAMAQRAAGEANQAIATYNKLATLRPKAPEPLLGLAAVHFGAKDYDASLQALRRALALKPDSLEVRREIIIVNVAAGRTGDALAEARVIQKERPKEAVGFVLEGDAYAVQKKWDRAESAYREALKRELLPVPLTRLHEVLQNQGKTPEANALVAKWLRENPKDVAVRSYLARRAVQENNFKEAARVYKEILSVEPDNAAILNSLAWAAMATQDPGALAYAEKAYALAPENVSVLDTYGWLLVQKGDAARAVEVLTAAASRAPKEPGIRFHLAKALIEVKDKAAARKEIEALLKLDATDSQRAAAEELLKGL